MEELYNIKFRLLSLTRPMRASAMAQPQRLRLALSLTLAFDIRANSIKLVF